MLDQPSHHTVCLNELEYFYLYVIYIYFFLSSSFNFNIKRSWAAIEENMGN